MLDSLKEEKRSSTDERKTSETMMTEATKEA